MRSKTRRKAHKGRDAFPKPLHNQPTGALDIDEACIACDEDYEITVPNLSQATSIQDVFAMCCQLRRRLHERPEIGFKEFKTAKAIKAVLAGAGITDVRDFALPGFVAYITGTGAPVGTPSNNGPKAVAIRAELDALPLQEGNLFLPYRSKNNGSAHSCGHDGHMASLVAAAFLIMAHRDRLPSDRKVCLLLQPAEEGPGGAAPMIQAGCLKGIDEVYAFHQDSASPYGMLRVKSGSAGPCYMHNARFTITINGVGGHGASPARTKDPVPPLMSMILLIQTIVSRSVDTLQDSLVVSVTWLKTATDSSNIIPDWASCGGTIRDVNPNTFEMVCARIHAIAEGSASAAGCTAKVEIVDMYPAVFNHDTQAEAVARVGRTQLDDVVDDPLTETASEDFAYYLGCDPYGKIKGITGAMFQLGNKDELRMGMAEFEGMGNGLEGGKCWNGCSSHNPGYDFNDNILPIASTMWVRLIEDRLGCKLYTEEELPRPKINKGTDQLSA